ncbi:MAG TPA: dephospho-CoA kinase [Anaerolineae bacterium]|nr:dephospho-CoA kinase [Anaerolineae bacterium]HID84951.1 dephospho-CoA kinase [Anaerolineales bacterium]HIQ08201.1 dephospho-CoA kinase [Anaerolineaceae bacterium]
MSHWPGKFIIGLTGNIATGKSVVRKMLEHLGAYTIDADMLAHRAIAKGAPGYQPVIDTFGKWILGPNGEIDRKKLAAIVFSDPEALQRLEAIVHPLVGEAIDWLARHSPRKVIVIEAIKLLESDLKGLCDSVWVVDASPETQLARLMRKRGMSEREARRRIAAQPPQQAKVAAADVVIHNDGSFEDTWKQVVAAWRRVVARATGTEAQTGPVTVATSASYHVERGGPRQAEEIARFISQVTRGQRQPTRTDILAAFGEQAYLLLRRGKQLVGLAGWQVENLISRTIEFYLAPEVDPEQGIPLMVQEIERGSQELQCEAALIFLLPAMLQANPKVWERLGYQVRQPQDLGVRAWQEAARESQPPGTVMLFKQLRKDRVLHPI